MDPLSSPQHAPLKRSTSPSSEDWEWSIPKDKATPIIFQWLENTLEQKEGATVSKRHVHARYVAFCRANSIQATTSSAFGKLLLSAFPHVSSRRIGKRSDAENHYTNLAWRAASSSSSKVPSREQRQGAEGTTSISISTTTSSKRKRDHTSGTITPWEMELMRRNHPLHARPVQLWNANAHLDVASKALMFVGTYKEEYWVATPLHPAVVDSTNVLHLMCTSDGDHERSALSFTVLFASSMGALLRGHIDVARDLYEKAREHLGDIFDVADYGVAQALERMPALARFFCSSPEEAHRLSSYYIALSMQMCRSLGAMNSFTYLQGMLSSDWYSVIDHRQFDALDQHPYFSGLEGSPQHIADRFSLPFHAQKKLVVCFHCVSVLIKAIWQYRSQCYPDRYKFASDNSLNNSEETSHSAEPQAICTASSSNPLAISNLVAADQKPVLHSETPFRPPSGSRSRAGGGGGGENSKKKKKKKKSPHQSSSRGPSLRMPTYPFSSTSLSAPEDLEPLFPVLDNASRSLGDLLAQGFLSPNLHAVGILHFESLRAEVLWCQGRREEALAVAWECVRVLEETSKFAHFTSLPVVDMTLNILVQMHAWEGVERVLARVSDFFARSTGWRDTRDKHTTRMLHLRAFVARQHCRAAPHRGGTEPQRHRTSGTAVLRPTKGGGGQGDEDDYDNAGHHHAWKPDEAVQRGGASPAVMRLSHILCDDDDGPSSQ